MRVQEVSLENGGKSYLLIGNDGMPIYPVAKYLKYLDLSGKSINTIKTYCYSLKAFYEFLAVIETDYSALNFGTLIHFVGWLRTPYNHEKVISLSPPKAIRSEKSCNLITTVVVNYYDYLYRAEFLANDITDKLMKQISSTHVPKYKDFLYHVSKNRPKKSNILRLKEPRKKIKVLSKSEVDSLYQATTNMRDKFLIRLLFETGLRIGEALSLYIEDFVFDLEKGHKIVLTDRPQLSNGARLKSGGREIYVSQELMNLYDDYLYMIFDEYAADTNFVFIKLRGNRVGCPMEYSDVSALFKVLKKKTGLNVYPHLFRHTHATIYYENTKDIRQVQERLGHAQIQTTMNTYLHLSEQEVRESWKVAEVEFLITEACK